MNQIEEIRKQNGINGGFAEVVEFLVKTESKKKSTPPPSRTCEYRDEVTGHACRADNWLEEDHIIPVAQGGTDAPENKRWLCRTHNQLEAQRKLGALANHRGPNTRRLQLKAANRIAEFRAETLKSEGFVRLH